MAKLVLPQLKTRFALALSKPLELKKTPVFGGGTTMLLELPFTSASTAFVLSWRAFPLVDRKLVNTAVHAINPLVSPPDPPGMVMIAVPPPPSVTVTPDPAKFRVVAGF